MLDYTIQEKRRDLSSSSCNWYRQTPRENELRNKYPTLSYIPYEVQQGLYVGYTNRMSAALFPPFSIEIGDFVTWVKARNAFLIRGFLPSDAANLVIKIQNQH